MCPVKAASVAKGVEVQLDQEHCRVPLGVCTDLMCLRRSEVLEKLAEQVLPQGMSHWHTRPGAGVGSGWVCARDGVVGVSLLPDAGHLKF